MFQGVGQVYDPFDVPLNVNSMDDHTWWISTIGSECFTVSTLAHHEIPTDHIEYSHSIQPQDSPRVDDLLYKHDGGFNRDHPTVTPLRWSNWWTTSGDQTLLSKDSPHLYDGGLQISDDHSWRSPEKRSRISPTNCTLRSNPQEVVELGFSQDPCRVAPDSTPNDHDTPLVLETTEAPHGIPDDFTNDAGMVIGSVHLNGKFKCARPGCARKSFARQAELKRHYDTIHAMHKPAYWCRAVSCPRARANGGYAFTRRDKLKDHECKVHGGRH